MRAPARPRSCFAFSLIATVTALGLLIFAGVTGAEVKPGEMVGADNAEQVKDLVSPGVFYKVQHGMTMKIVPSERVPPFAPSS